MYNLPANILRSIEFDFTSWNTPYWGVRDFGFKLCLYVVHGKRDVQYHLGRFKWSPAGWIKLPRTVSVYSNALLALDAFNVRREELRNQGYRVLEVNPVH